MIRARIYQEASGACAAEAKLTCEGDTVQVGIPAEAVPGEQIHVIFQAQARGHFRLVHYQQVIITVK